MQYNNNGNNGAGMPATTGLDYNEEDKAVPKKNSCVFLLLLAVVLYVMAQG